MISHDQLFKNLLERFFAQFLAAFVPGLYRALDIRSKNWHFGAS